MAITLPTNKIPASTQDPKRLIIFSLIIILIIFLNSFVFKLFNRWTLFLFTVILLIIKKSIWV